MVKNDDSLLPPAPRSGKLLVEVLSDSTDETRILDATPLTEEERKRREEARSKRLGKTTGTLNG